MHLIQTAARTGGAIRVRPRHAFGAFALLGAVAAAALIQPSLPLTLLDAVVLATLVIYAANAGGLLVFLTDSSSAVDSRAMCCSLARVLGLLAVLPLAAVALGAILLNGAGAEVYAFAVAAVLIGLALHIVLVYISGMLALVADSHRR